jgi:predicted alpha/beta hydrolase
MKRGAGWPNDGPQGAELKQAQDLITRAMREETVARQAQAEAKQGQATVEAVRRGSGWQEERPLRSPMDDWAMQQLDAHLSERPKVDLAAALEAKIAELQREIDELKGRGE